MKLSALFSDYDGTLARDDIRVQNSKIPKATDRALRTIAKRVPLALITLKDFGFIFPRTSYASGWACVGGLEVVLSSGSSIVRRHGHAAEIFIQEVQSEMKGEVRIERKVGTGGEVLGFSVDWRGKSHPDPAKLAKLMAEASDRNLLVRKD